MGACWGDDRLVLYAPKTLPANQSKTGKQVTFPLMENGGWKYVKNSNNWKYLKAEPTGRYIHKEIKCPTISSEDYLALDPYQAELWRPTYEYSLRPSALAGINKEDQIAILKDVRINITVNAIFIILTNVLTAIPGSRKQIAKETIKALNNIGVIKGDWSPKSADVMAYRILENYFWPTAYEIRFDSNQTAGMPLYNHCKWILRNKDWIKELKAKNKRDNEIFNKIPLVSPGTGTKKQQWKAQKARGFNEWIYNRALRSKANMQADPNLFTIRHEIELLSKLLKDDQNEKLNIQGSAIKIMDRIEPIVKKRLQTRIKAMKAEPQFDLFVNNKPTGNCSGPHL